MPRRKDRIPVVLDTNVFIRNFKSRSRQSPNKVIVRLWLVERWLQLIVSDPVIEEYLDIFRDVIQMDEETLEQWRIRLTADPRSTPVRLGRKYSESRDPNDNLMLATAYAGKAAYLITNDRDLLELSEGFRKTVRFEIVSPEQFLHEFGSR